LSAPTAPRKLTLAVSDGQLAAIVLSTPATKPQRLLTSPPAN
jgi:hypothetical protein